LRYLSDAYRTLRRSVPEKYKTEEVLDLEAWLGAELLQIDASLLEEWEKLEQPNAFLERKSSPAAEEAPAADITRDRRALAILVRNACFRIVRAVAARDFSRVLVLLAELAPEGSDNGLNGAGEPWSRASLEQLFEPYWAEHAELLVDGDSRSAARCAIDTTPASEWKVRQVLSDREEDYDWALALRLDLDASREQGRLILQLLGLENG
jgi:hypothetical protein